MTSDTLKCPSCKLVQFVNAAATCKRCKRALRPVVVPPAVREKKRYQRARGTPTVVLNTTVRPETLAGIKVHAKRQGMALGEMVDEMFDTWVLKNAEEAMRKEAR